MDWGRVFKNIGIILVRTIAVIFLFSAALLVGIMIGYTFLGKGSPNPLDIFDAQMWRELIHIALH
ncbi:DNA-directed RNA polymerase subunit beta [Allofustis seminis]|uniref:DNA-directed RNA polymerase subunit beta n=1 Tax=Allofustis seminis TaxID=166939 RepID=UPI00037DD41C|nr:DNA-directed RNA polymerase subunit beta [Allofustis seminis]